MKKRGKKKKRAPKDISWFEVFITGDLSFKVGAVSLLLAIVLSIINYPYTKGGNIARRNDLPFEKSLPNEIMVTLTVLSLAVYCGTVAADPIDLSKLNNRHPQKKSWAIASCVLFIFSLLHFATYFELFIALFENRK